MSSSSSSSSFTHKLKQLDLMKKEYQIKEDTGTWFGFWVSFLLLPILIGALSGIQIYSTVSIPNSNSTIYLPLSTDDSLSYNVEVTCQSSGGCLAMTYCNGQNIFTALPQGSSRTLTTCLATFDVPLIYLYSRSLQVYNVAGTANFLVGGEGVSYCIGSHCSTGSVNLLLTQLTLQGIQQANKFTASNTGSVLPASSVQVTGGGNYTSSSAPGGSTLGTKSLSVFSSTWTSMCSQMSTTNCQNIPMSPPTSLCTDPITASVGSGSLMSFPSCPSYTSRVDSTASYFNLQSPDAVIFLTNSYINQTITYLDGESLYLYCLTSIGAMSSLLFGLVRPFHDVIAKYLAERKRRKREGMKPQVESSKNIKEVEGEKEHQKEIKVEEKPKEIIKSANHAQISPLPPPMPPTLSSFETLKLKWRRLTRNTKVGILATSLTVLSGLIILVVLLTIPKPASTTLASSGSSSSSSNSSSSTTNISSTPLVGWTSGSLSSSFVAGAYIDLSLTYDTSFNGSLVTISTYSDSSCTNSASSTGLQGNTVLVSTAGLAAFTTMDLTATGTFYLQASLGSTSSFCLGASYPIVITHPTYSFSGGSFASSYSAGKYVGLIITFGSSSYSGTAVTVQLYSDSGCATLLSGSGLTGNSATISSSGVATFSTLTASTTGTYFMRAALGSISSYCMGTTYSLVITPPTYSFTAGSFASSYTAGTYLGLVLTFGSSSYVSYATTVQLYTDSSCSTAASGTGLVGSTGTTSSTGVVTFSSLSASTAGTYYLLASLGSISSYCLGGTYTYVITHPTYSFTAGSFSSSYLAGGTIGLSASFGSAYSGVSSTISAYSDSSCSTAASAIGLSGNSATLSSAGAASFGSLLMTLTGTYYLKVTLSNSASSSYCLGVSYPFVITSAAPSTLSYSTLPSGSRKYGVAITPAPAILATDAYGNGALGYTITLAAFSDSSCSTSLLGTLSVTSTAALPSGLATFSNIIVTLNSPYTSPYSHSIYLKATYGSVSICSSSAAIVVVPNMQTIAGMTTFGYANGAGLSSTFNQPGQMAFDSSRNIYIADTVNHQIRMISATDGTVSLFCGSPTATAGVTNGACANALFSYPTGIQIDSSNNIYVADLNQIRVISSGVVSLLAGSPSGASGYQDGTGSAALFNGLQQLVLDSSNNIFVVEASLWSGTFYGIRKVTNAGVVTSLCGQTTSIGSIDGTGTGAGFKMPYGIAIDSNNYMYLTDWEADNIRKVSPAGEVTTYAGSGTAGSTDGQGIAANLYYPRGICVDSNGIVYAAEQAKIRQISTDQYVSSLAGTGSTGSMDAAASYSTINNPYALLIDSTNTLIYIADTNNDNIRLLTI